MTNLRDSFRQAALVSSKKPFEEFEAEVAKLRARLDKVRGLGLTPPDVYFKLAQRKVSAGDYTFDLDAEGEESALPPAGGEKRKPKNLLAEGVARGQALVARRVRQRQRRAGRPDARILIPRAVPL